MFLKSFKEENIMSLETTQELVQLDIAQQNSANEESIISTAYSWYRWGRVAKTFGQLALSATPSGAIKFGAQLALQPIADKISEKTGYSSIGTAVKIGIACTDPVGSTISYGIQWATDTALKHYEIKNPHLKAVLKITSQEASSQVVTVVKTSETYQAASDCISQKFEETTLGLNVKSLQQKIDDQCEKIDKHETVKAMVKKGNETVDTLSKKAAALPGVEKINEAKQQLTEMKTAISKKLENQVTNKIAEKFRELDNSGATMIRNSRLKEIEVNRQSLESRLEKILEKKNNSESKLKKWQELKLKAEISKDEAVLAKANAKLAKHQKIFDRASRKETNVNARLDTMEKNITKNTAQLKQLRFKELNNKLEILTAKQRLLQSALEKARTDEAKNSIKEQLMNLEKEISETALFCESCIAEETESGDNEAESHAIEVMPALKALRERNKVIVRVWLPKEDGRLTSQLQATKGAFFANKQMQGSPTSEYVVGHVSIEMPDGEYVSWWPGEPIPNGTSVVQGAFNTYQGDVRAEGHDPDRTFFLYTLDTNAMNQELLKFQKLAEASNFGWTLFDNRILRNNETTPSGQPVSKTAGANPDSVYITENGTSCSGLVKKLLLAGGLDKLASIPDNIGSFISRNFLSSPENITQLLESAELAENAAYLETRNLRREDAANTPLSNLFEKPLENGFAFFNSKNTQGNTSDLDNSDADDYQQSNKNIFDTSYSY
jgi:hypothetical protein